MAKKGCAGTISGSKNAFANKVQAAFRSGGGAEFEAVNTARTVAGKYPLVAAMKQVAAHGPLCGTFE